MAEEHPANSLKKASKLLIADATDKKSAAVVPFYARQILKCEPKECTLFVKSWEELDTRLRQYDTIERLVLFLHGEAGQLFIGHVNKSLSDAEKLFPGRRPRITQRIDIDACNVGRAPDQIIPFARVFKAPQISAYTYFNVTHPLPLSVTPGDSVKSLEKKLGHYNEFLLQGTSLENLVKKPGKHTVILSWFREDLNATVPPVPGRGPDMTRNYKRRSQAIEKEITSDEAMALSQSLSGPSTSVEFMFITINISYPSGK